MTDKRKLKTQIINKRDDLLSRLRDTWGVGKSRSEQAKRLEQGIIDPKRDGDAVKALALFVNMELAINAIELLELTDIFEKEL